MISRRGQGRRLAALVLLLALAVTGFGVWREHEIIRQNQIIRCQSSLDQLLPLFQQAISQQFEGLRDQAKTTLRRENYSPGAWNDFLTASEWQSRYPGMLEIGYATYAGEHCPVMFLASRMTNSPHAAGFDLNRDGTIRPALEKSADGAYGIGSDEITLGTGTNAVPVIVGLLPLVKYDQVPGTAAANRANLQGFIFFALNQQRYFEAIREKMVHTQVNLRLLTADEAAPPRSLTQRVITLGGVSGKWRFVASLKTPTVGTAAPQYIVAASGIALSLLLYFLFASQARLRLEAEAANGIILQRETEILALNHDLETKVADRTLQLNEALAKEKELNRLKGNFISMVTHEIRTPLALILGSSEILSRYLDRLTPDKRRDHLRTIDSAVHRMTALMEDVLLFSKAESGRMDFNPSMLDLPGFCTQLTDELASATNRRCPLVLALDGITEPARGDESLLRHIFSNLIANAVKYSPPGSPVDFTVSRAGGDAVFTVRDRGMGIPGDDCQRLFTPFYRGKNVATIQGTGLGLVIVKHCVEQHGGTIEIQSVEKAGTTVTVRLPLFSPAHTEFIYRLTQSNSHEKNPGN